MIYNTENKKSFKQSENNRCSEKKRRILNIYMVTCLSWLRRFLSIFLGFINSVWWFRILVGGGSIKRMLWWETAWSGNSCGVFSLLIWISPPLPVSVKIFIMPPSVCLLQSKHKSIKDNIMLTPFPSWLDRVNEKRNYLRNNRLQLKFFFSLYFTARWDQGALIDPWQYSITVSAIDGKRFIILFTLDVEIKTVFCFSHHFSSVQGFCDFNNVCSASFFDFDSLFLFIEL